LQHVSSNQPADHWPEGIGETMTVVSVIAARIYLKRRPIETDRPELNRRGRQYVGRTFTVAEAVETGRG
jgi:hypothetical protein